MFFSLTFQSNKALKKKKKGGRGGGKGRGGKLQSHSNPGLGFDLWMRTVQCSSACPDSRQAFEPFSPSFQGVGRKPNQCAKTQLSAPSFHQILEPRHTYHQILSFLVYSCDMFLFILKSVSKITKSLITNCWVGKVLF